MDKKEFERKLNQKTDVDTLYNEHLHENRIGLLQRIIRGFQETSGLYQKSLHYLVLFLMCGTIIHITTLQHNQGDIPLFVTYAYTSVYSLVAIGMILPLLWQIGKSLKQTHEKGTYTKDEFTQFVAAEKMVDEIRELLQVVLNNNVAIARTKKKVKKIIDDIAAIKYSTERGGKLTKEIEAKTKLTLTLLDGRYELIGDTLYAASVRSLLKYAVKHPDCSHTKNAIIMHFSDNVLLTVTGYKKLDKIAEEIYQYYMEHGISPDEQIAQLNKLIQQFTRHNQKLMEGDVRKSA